MSDDYGLPLRPYECERCRYAKRVLILCDWHRALLGCETFIHPMQEEVAIARLARGDQSSGDAVERGPPSLPPYIPAPAERTASPPPPEPPRPQGFGGTAPIGAIPPPPD